MLVVLGLVCLGTGLLVYIRELGPYLVGRRLVGIPGSDIDIVLRLWSQHVALRDGERWARPTSFSHYLETYEQYDTDSTHLATFLAAGELAQTVGVVGLAGGFVLSGVRPAAELLVLISALIICVYWFVDLGRYFHLGSLTGRFSALWRRSVAAGIGLVVFVGVVHGGLYLGLS